VSVAARRKEAATPEAGPGTIVHGPVCEHAPPHPAKIDPGAGSACSETLPAVGKPESHAWGQWIPSGSLTTDPVPEIVTWTRAKLGTVAAGPNVALTGAVEPAVAGQRLPRPTHPPFQPMKYEPDPGSQQRYGGPGRAPVQTFPQAIPAGELVTVPTLPLRVTVTVVPDGPGPGGGGGGGIGPVAKAAPTA
jgi:hypothetical protein